MLLVLTRLAENTIQTVLWIINQMVYGQKSLGQIHHFRHTQ